MRIIYQAYRHLLKDTDLNKTLRCTIGLALLALSSLVCASNTSGVHGPNVKEGDKSMMLRIALSPADEDGQADNWAYRLHYQQAFNDKVRGRIIVQYRDRGEFQYEYIRGEILYNFKKKSVNGIWSSGVRFDLRQRRGSRPQEFAMHWTNQWDLSNGYTLRGILVGARQFGSDQRASGTLIETRASINKKLESGISIGIESFGGYGQLGEFGSFNDQSHQIGPVISGSFAGFKYNARYLAGVSNGTRDHNFGLFINKSF